MIVKETKLDQSSFTVFPLNIIFRENHFNHFPSWFWSQVNLIQCIILNFVINGMTWAVVGKRNR